MLTVLYRLKSIQEYFFLLHLLTAVTRLDKMPLSFSPQCIRHSLCFQTVCAATELTGLLEVNKTFLEDFFTYWNNLDCKAQMAFNFIKQD